VPDGPRKITERHQITLPFDQLEALGVDAGDSVWVSINPDREGTLIVMTNAVMREVFQFGWAATGRP
jgi:bifunctional DNA-binding transcriptional regulator/antitoxin component of YhaV-PrlF toxin-antitoxin module